jgi:membrane protease YdiL (CAAX protease family)
MGLTYGAVYALTGNVWLVARFHATMNYPPFLLAVNVPTEIHFVVAVVEYAGILSVVHLSGRLTDGAGWLSLDPT